MHQIIGEVRSKKIREARRAKGLSQNELAERVGVSRVSISHLENGQRSSIKPEILHRLAEVLEKPETYFYREAVLSFDIFPEPLREVIMHLLDLPEIEQKRLGHIFKEIIDLRCEMEHTPGHSDSSSVPGVSQ